MYKLNSKIRFNDSYKNASAFLSNLPYNTAVQSKMLAIYSAAIFLWTCYSAGDIMGYKYSILISLFWLTSIFILTYLSMKSPIKNIKISWKRILLVFTIVFIYELVNLMFINIIIQTMAFLWFILILNMIANVDRAKECFFVLLQDNSIISNHLALEFHVTNHLMRALLVHMILLSWTLYYVPTEIVIYLPFVFLLLFTMGQITFLLYFWVIFVHIVIIYLCNPKVTYQTVNTCAKCVTAGVALFTGYQAYEIKTASVAAVNSVAATASKGASVSVKTKYLGDWTVNIPGTEVKKK